MGTGYIRNDTVNNIADGNIINASDLDGEFDAVAAAFVASTGHNHDGANNGAPITKVGPNQEVITSTSSIYPAVNNTIDLGTAANQYKNLYVDGIAYVDGIDFNGTGITATGTEINYLSGVTSAIQTQISAKQDTLVSGTSIKTVNSTSLLGSGNVAVGTVTSVTAGTGLSGGTITGSGTIAIDSTVTTLTGTQTLTNKRITSRVVSAGSTSGTLTPNGDTTDIFNALNLAGAITLATPSGTPTDGQRLIIRLEDNGTGRAITWTTTSGAYRAVGVTLPTTTIASKVTYVGCIYNTTDGFWDVVAAVTQA